jgi:hypothetical protein
MCSDIAHAAGWRMSRITEIPREVECSSEVSGKPGEAPQRGIGFQSPQEAFQCGGVFRLLFDVDKTVDPGGRAELKTFQGKRCRVNPEECGERAREGAPVRRISFG